MDAGVEKAASAMSRGRLPVKPSWFSVNADTTGCR